MSLVTLNGLDVIEAAVQLPRSGLWTADVRVASSASVAGRVAISIQNGGLTLAGTVRRSGIWQDTLSLSIVGGAGGLGHAPPPRHYGSTSVRIVLADLLRAAGETLSPASSPSVLAHPINGWTSHAIPIGRLITRLMAEAPGASWRALPDGTIWVGTETWPASTIDFALLDHATECGEALLGIEALPPLPGQTIDLSVTKTPDVRRISLVEYVLADPGPRARVFFEDAAPSTLDRLRDAIAGVTAQALGPIDYRALYLARVVSQSGAVIDVAPDDARLPSMGRVPLMVGFPGASVAMPAGGRVLIGWSGGDPARPFALAFDGDTRATQINIAGGGPAAARQGDAVTLTLSPVDIGTLATALLATGGFTPAGGPPGPGPAPLPLTGGQIVSGSAIVKVG